MKTHLARWATLALGLGLAACVTADPAVVARAVSATLTAAVTPTPIVVVVTALGGPPAALPTVTPDAGMQQTLAAATQTLAAASATPLPSAATAAPLTRTPPPTDTLTPTTGPSTLAPGAPVSVGALIFADDFSQPDRWAAGEDEQHRIAVADGRLSISVKAPDRFFIVYNIQRRAGDFYAAVTGTAAACRYRDRYGLLFRVQDAGNYYQFEVDCDGRYRLAKVVEGGLTPLQDWAASRAIQPGDGAVNELGVRAAGPALEVFANRQSLLTVGDPTYAEGSFGLYAGSGVSGAYTAVFDNLRVWELSK